MGGVSSDGGQAQLFLRSHGWGSLFVVVAQGEIDATNVHRLDGYLSRLQDGRDVILDLVDVSCLDSRGVAALKSAKKRADRSGWGFAVVARPLSQCVDAIREDRIARHIRTFSNRHAARTAIQRSPR